MLETFRALAEPSRLQIFDLLAGGPLPVGEVVDRLGMRQPQASKHLKVLSEAGLVEMRPEAQRRIYALRAKPLQELDEWLKRYRNMLEEQFARLDEVLREEQKRMRRGGSKAKPRSRRTQ